jgi:hypothetical protein
MTPGEGFESTRLAGRLVDVFEERIARKLDSLNVREDPLKVAEGARLLAEVQEYLRLGATLEARVAAYVNGANEAVRARSLADWAFDVLSNADGPMQYRDIAAAIRAQGFTRATPEERREAASRFGVVGDVRGCPLRQSRPRDLRPTRTKLER